MPPTFKGFDVKLHSAYRPFQILEGEGPVEGVVVAEFPSMEEAKRQGRNPKAALVSWHFGIYRLLLLLGTKPIEMQNSSFAVY
jgi:hypothetical protein